MNSRISDLSAAASSSPRPESSRTPLLAVEGIRKSFGGVQALKGVSLQVHAGEVHALVGANGAGKSTLLKILAGLVTPDAGTIQIDGREVQIHHPTDATRLGLNFIHQELHLVPGFTVLQNMMLGHPEAGRAGFLDLGRMRARAQAVIERLGVDLDLDEAVELLSVHRQWMVALGHALMRDARVVAMDEPTASFTEAETDHLFQIIRGLTAGGGSVIYVSHRLPEVLAISERLTVLRDGGLMGTWPTESVNRKELTHRIVGHLVEELEAPAEAPRQGVPVLALSGIAREPRVRSVSFECHAGEILGLAGLVGAGRTEIARIVFGVDRPTSGSMLLNGRPYKPRSPYEAIRSGVALIPEERRSQGLVLHESIAFNVSLATNRANRLRWWFPLVSMRRKRDAAREMIQKLGIKARSTDAPVVELSGGNQQKVVVAKWLRAGPKVLILDEPTAGVDVGARDDMYALISELAAQGAAIVLISSDFEELQLCHRVVVLREGVVTHVATGDAISKDALTRLCYEGAVAS